MKVWGRGLNRTRPRGTPDRRGMGAQSDFIAEQFVPSESYKAQQATIAEQLLTTGIAPEKIAGMFLVPYDPQGKK